MSAAEPPIEQLATQLWGEPNRKLSTRTELRFGTNGSKAVKLKERTWFDHEAGEGGGYRDLYAKAYGERPAGQSIVAAYDYRDAQDRLVFQVVRMVPKTFRQRRPDGAGGWIWKMDGIQRVPYRLPELLHAAPYAPVFICEGEKDCDALLERGLVATTNPGGAGKWQASICDHFRGRDVVILPDNDDAGRKHAADVASKLQGIAKSIRVLNLPDLPPKGDVADWLGAGGTAEELEELSGAIVEYRPNGPNGHGGNGHDRRADDGENRPNGKANGATDYASRLPVIPRRMVSLADFAGHEPAPRQWIMENWIPRGQCTGLYGAKGHNKTYWMLQLGMAASRGLVFCGIQITRCPVVMWFCEDTVDEIVWRAKRIAAHHGLTPADFPDFYFQSLVGSVDTEFMTFDGPQPTIQLPMVEFHEELVRRGAGLAGLDTLPDVYGGDELKRRQISTFIRWLDTISICDNCAIVLPAHPSVRGWREGTMDSGSTAWAGKFRSRLSLKDPGEPDDDNPNGRRTRTDRRILRREDSNYAAVGEEIELVWRDGVFTTAALDPERAAARAIRGPARDAACEAKFLELLDKAGRQGIYLHDASNNPGRFAPKVLSGRPDGQDFGQGEFYRAMGRLFAAGRLRMENYGPKSRAMRRLAGVPQEGLQ